MPDIITEDERKAVAKWLRRNKPKQIPRGVSAFNFTPVWKKTPGGYKLVYKELCDISTAERQERLRGSSTQRGGNRAAGAALKAYHQRQRAAAAVRRTHVRQLKASGMAAPAIAGKLGISQATVYKDLKQ